MKMRFSYTFIVALFAVAAILHHSPHSWSQISKMFVSQAFADENNQKDDGQKGQKDDGQQNQKDDGQKGQNDDGQKGQKDDGQQNQVVLKNVDLKTKVVTLVRKEKGENVEQTLPLGKDVQVMLNGKAAKVADLKEGMKLNVLLSKDNKEVVAIKQGENNQKNDGQKNQKNDK